MAIILVYTLNLHHVNARAEVDVGVIFVLYWRIRIGMYVLKLSYPNFIESNFIFGYK